jgi:septum formation topological specificity factor MinE
MGSDVSMNFFTWLTTKRKTLGNMDVAELRAQEMLLENERDRMQAKIGKLAQEKEKIVERGAKERTPELRRTFAQQFDLLHTEQMMLSRHLNIRSKELLTVSRLRMLRESAQRARIRPGTIATIREHDLAVIEKLIEDDAITSEMYQQRLDEILQLGIEADKEAAGVSPAARELMRIWEDMDAGLIKGTKEAADEAEKRVRERKKAAEG